MYSDGIVWDYYTQRICIWDFNVYGIVRDCYVKKWELLLIVFR